MLARAVCGSLFEVGINGDQALAITRALTVTRFDRESSSGDNIRNDNESSSGSKNGNNN